MAGAVTAVAVRDVARAEGALVVDQNAIDAITRTAGKTEIIEEALVTAGDGVAAAVASAVHGHVVSGCTSQADAGGVVVAVDAVGICAVVVGIEFAQWVGGTRHHSNHQRQRQQ